MCIWLFNRVDLHYCCFLLFSLCWLVGHRCIGVWWIPKCCPDGDIDVFSFHFVKPCVIVSKGTLDGSGGQIALYSFFISFMATLFMFSKVVLISTMLFHHIALPPNPKLCAEGAIAHGVPWAWIKYFWLLSHEILFMPLGSWFCVVMTPPFWNAQEMLLLAMEGSLSFSITLKQHCLFSACWIDFVVLAVRLTFPIFFCRIGVLHCCVRACSEEFFDAILHSLEKEHLGFCWCRMLIGMLSWIFLTFQQWCFGFFMLPLYCDLLKFADVTDIVNFCLSGCIIWHCALFSACVRATVISLSHCSKVSWSWIIHILFVLRSHTTSHSAWVVDQKKIHNHWMTVKTRKETDSGTKTVPNTVGFQSCPLLVVDKAERPWKPFLTPKLHKPFLRLDRATSQMRS